MKRNILNKELWYSFVAIVRYFPKAIITPQVNGMDFYTREKQEEFLIRVQHLKPDSVRAWGTMNVAQMMHHLSLSLGGVGNSGMGSYYGRYGYEALTHAKSILHGPSGQPIEHLIPPYTREKIEGLNQWFVY